MSEFFEALLNPALPFLRLGVFASLLAAPAFGIVGSYVVVNRVSYLAGAVSHSILAGIGLALFLEDRLGLRILSPFWGGLIAALVSAILVARLSSRGKERSDAVISMVWALGASLGLVFMAWTPGFIDPMAYLFGNILLLAPEDLVSMVVLDVLILGTAMIFYPQFLALSFDEEFARVRGMKTGFHLGLLLVLTGAAVMLLVSTVGIVLVIALLTLPASASGFFAKSLKGMMIGASIISLASLFFGLMLSYLADLPTGAGIVIVAVLIYGLFRIMAGLAGRAREARPA